MPFILHIVYLSEKIQPEFMRTVSMRETGSSTYVFLAGIVFVLLAATVQAKAVPATKDFVQQATIGNQFEISSSRLALANSQDDDVKAFAQQMVDDHTQIGNQLKSVITNSDAKIPMPDPALDSGHQKILDRLNDLKGNAFDREYVKAQVNAHDEAVSLFRGYARKGDNAALRDFAAHTLPTLRDHQQHAQHLASAQM